jgi:hypothetical protein
VREDIQEVEAPSARVTRSSARKLQIQEEKSVQEEKKIEIDEGKHTFNRLRMQLKKSHSEIVELKEQDERARKNIMIF